MDKLPQASSQRAAAQMLLGIMHHRTQSAPKAVELLGQSLAGGGALPEEWAVMGAEQLFAAAGAAGDRGAAMVAVSVLARLGRTGAAESRLAELLLEWPPGVAGEERLASALSLLAVQEGAAVAQLLDGSWKAARARLQAARRARQGYFAGELQSLSGAASGLAAELEYGTAAAIEIDPRLSHLAGRAAQRVAELLSELVAYQPLRPEALDLRQALLQVVLACREEAAASGLGLRAAGNGPEGGPAPPPAGVWLDPALVKGALRQVVLRLARVAAETGFTRPAGPEAPRMQAVLSAAATSPAGGDAGASVAASAGAVFTFTLAVSPAAGAVLDIAARLRELISASTVPDIAARAGGTYTVRSGEGGASCEVKLQFAAAAGPPTLCAEGVPTGLLAAGVLEEIHPDLPARLDDEGAARAAARSMLQAVAAGREREVVAWGGELAVILHELKNSLAFVGSWLHESELYDWETVRQRCLENLTDIRFWLDEAGVMLSREDGAAQPYVDLGEIVRRVLRGLAAGMSRKRVRLELGVGENLPKVPAQPLLAASVVRNLARNAVEVTPEGEMLSVSVVHLPQAARVAVSFGDRGPGFPPEILAGQDAGFSQSGLSRPHLGLLSARRILAEQGGELLLGNDAHGGRAEARFTTGEAASRLAEAVGDFSRLSPETRQALRAAAALVPAGEAELARHLWRRAIEIEAGRLTRSYQHHRALPVAIGLAAGKGGRPALAPRAQAALGRIFGPDELPRAENAARWVLGEVLANRLRPADLSPRQSALLLWLLTQPAASASGGAPQRDAAITAEADKAAGAVRLLFAAGEALEGGISDPPELERAVLDALRALSSLGAAGALE